MSKITSKNINIQNKRILTYDDMAAVQPGNSQEPLVDVRTYSPTIIAEYEQSDMHFIRSRKKFICYCTM